MRCSSGAIWHVLEIKLDEMERALLTRLNHAILVLAARLEQERTWTEPRHPIRPQLRGIAEEKQRPPSYAPSPVLSGDDVGPRVLT